MGEKKFWESQDERSNQTRPRQPSHDPHYCRQRGTVADADERQRGSENGAELCEISAYAQRRQTMRRVQSLRRSERLQVCRRRHLAEGVVRALGEEGGVKLPVRVPLEYFCVR